MLSAQSLNVLAELRGEDPPQDVPEPGILPDVPMQFVGGEGEGDNGDGWEDVEDNGFTQAVRDLIGWRCVTNLSRLCVCSLVLRNSYNEKYKDARTWRQRVERMDRNWKDTLPSLVDAPGHH